MTNIPKTGIGVKVAKNGSIIPYLMFANDCMIFCKATKSVARIKEILENYCKVPGRLVIIIIAGPIF